ncbi:MAG: TIGR03960 family B12-binding radical SAM protein [Deltaproteobacteria bacterium]|nr:TIGR03960 family B12-binding radical SAM protein [Deltaproteobacteria bacterium]
MQPPPISSADDGRAAAASPRSAQVRAAASGQAPLVPGRPARMNLRAVLDQHLLSRVEKPSRYLGSEVNAVTPDKRDLREVRVRIALAFPDLYDIGLGNLGLHILYAVLNQRPWAWCERVYAPGLDMERLLREDGLPLFALESKDSLDAFDGIGFTLQSELTFTNILNIIDLAGMPVRTAHRREHDPLTFAGGPAVFNPEPLAPFMDFFVFGDGEDIIVEIAELFDKVKGREARLDALSQMPGVYVPARFPMEQLEDGRILPPVDAPKIQKRIARSLDGATFPVEYIVPFTRQVHDRISLEVLRGCTQGCRFCQAGMTTRPVRERSIENISDLMRRTLDATGYEEVSLVSLSTCDYSQVKKMVDTVVRQAAPERVSVSLPSLRLDSFSVELADMVAGIRRTGLTVAPEAASPRLRALINKWIPDEDLLDMADKAFGLGWEHVKLYFMIGLPTEREDDVQAIADLTLRTLAAGRRHNKRAQVNTGVSTFVPKPFTPLQWAAQISVEETERRQAILSERFRRSGGAVKFGRHNPYETWLEGLVSRADRRGGDLIEAAWRLGARFDAWDEHLDIGIWREAIVQAGTDVDFELRERKVDERLPWDHIDILIKKEWFVEDWQRAMQLQHAQDCRHSKCHRCGVIDQERDLCAHMLRNSIAGRKPEAEFVRPPPPPELGQRNPEPGQPPVRPPEPPAVQRLVLRIGVIGEARHLAHLEAMNAWIRSLRRVRTPLCYTEGFHPHPRVAFSGARPLAEETLGDYMDILLHQRLNPAELVAQLQATVPTGFRVFSAIEVPLSAPSLMSTVAGADYLFFVSEAPADLGARVDALVAQEQILVQRDLKPKPGQRRRGPPAQRTIDLRPNVRSLRRGGSSAAVGLPRLPGEEVLEVSLDTVGGRGCRPSELIEVLGLEVAQVRVLRLDTRFSTGVASAGQQDEAVDEDELFAVAEA